MYGGHSFKAAHRFAHTMDCIATPGQEPCKPFLAVPNAIPAGAKSLIVALRRQGKLLGRCRFTRSDYFFR